MYVYVFFIPFLAIFSAGEIFFFYNKISSLFNILHSDPRKPITDDKFGPCACVLPHSCLRPQAPTKYYYWIIERNVFFFGMRKYYYVIEGISNQDYSFFDFPPTALHSSALTKYYYWIIYTYFFWVKRHITTSLKFFRFFSHSDQAYKMLLLDHQCKHIFLVGITSLKVFQISFANFRLAAVRFQKILLSDDL